MSVVEPLAKVTPSCCTEAPANSGAIGAPPITAAGGSDQSLGRDILLYLRNLLRDRRVLMAIAAPVIVGGAVLNWGWLVAVGAAPLILALAPCAAMCALGLCAMGKDGKSCGKSETPAPAAEDGGTAAARQVTRREPNASSQ